VEFGLLLPVLMFVLLGIIDYGQVFFTQLSITNAAREGARAGVVRPAEDAQSTAITAATSYLAAAGLSGNVAATTPTDATPTVTVTVTVAPYVPLVGFVPTPGQLQATSSMRWELATPTP
jgi:Flp pilus assembly protein TadG